MDFIGGHEKLIISPYLNPCRNIDALLITIIVIKSGNYCQEISKQMKNNSHGGLSAVLEGVCYIYTG